MVTPIDVHPTIRMRLPLCVRAVAAARYTAPARTARMGGPQGSSALWWNRSTTATTRIHAPSSQNRAMTMRPNPNDGGRWSPCDPGLSG